MRVEILVFKGDVHLSDDPYLRLGHVGVRFPNDPDVYGFGPATDLTAHESRLVPGEFSRHTQIFRRAAENGLSVVSLGTRCATPGAINTRLGHLSRLKFALPTSAPDEISSGVATNCVGALNFLGVLLPGSSLYISEILKLAHGAHRKFVIQSAPQATTLEMNVSRKPKR